MILKQKLDRDYIKLLNGDIINIDSIGIHIPFIIIRINPIYLVICEFIANNFYKYKQSSVEWKVLVNFLSQRSRKVKVIAAIVILGKKEKIAEINIEYFGAEFAHFFDYSIIFRNRITKSSYFIDKSQVVSSIVKYFPNKLYYILRSRNLKSTTSAIRTWVDVDEELHKEHFNSSTIYIYPFSINLMRGFKFVKHCFKKYKNVTLMGVPYSFNNVIKILLSSKIRRDYSILDFELDAMRQHSKEFFAFDSIYTSDEFIPAVNALYTSLLPSKNVVNNTHGIGFYNPYIKYTKMLTFNIPQRDYYLRRNNQVEYIIKDNYFKSKQFNRNLDSVIIYVDQGNLKKFGLFYENNLQNRVIAKIEQVAGDLHYKYFIKFHPNRKQKEKNSFLTNHNDFKEINSFDKNADLNYLFINLYSTAYYDFRTYGNFLFIKEDLFDPTYYFGNSIKTIKVDELKQNIINFLS